MKTFLSNRLNEQNRSIHKIEKTNKTNSLEGGFDSRRSTPFASGSSSRTPGSGGSLKIGRRSGERSKSPFRSFRWKRGTSRNIELDYDEEGNTQKQQQTIIIVNSASFLRIAILVFSFIGGQSHNLKYRNSFALKYQMDFTRHHRPVFGISHSH